MPTLGSANGGWWPRAPQAIRPARNHDLCPGHGLEPRSVSLQSSGNPSSDDKTSRSQVCARRALFSVDSLRISRTFAAWGQRGGAAWMLPGRSGVESPAPGVQPVETAPRDHRGRAASRSPTRGMAWSKSRSPCRQDRALRFSIVEYPGTHAAFDVSLSSRDGRSVSTVGAKGNRTVPALSSRRQLWPAS